MGLSSVLYFAGSLLCDTRCTSLLIWLVFASLDPSAKLRMMSVSYFILCCSDTVISRGIKQDIQCTLRCHQVLQGWLTYDEFGFLSLYLALNYVVANLYSSF